MNNDKINQALITAVKDGNVEVVKLLLEVGADVHAENDMAVAVAIYRKHIEVVRLLLDAGADVYADNGWALGHVVCDRVRNEVFKWLQEYSEPKELTLAEVNELLGYKVKIIE